MRHHPWEGRTGKLGWRSKSCWARGHWVWGLGLDGGKHARYRIWGQKLKRATVLIHTWISGEVLQVFGWEFRSRGLGCRQLLPPKIKKHASYQRILVFWWQIQNLVWLFFYLTGWCHSLIDIATSTLTQIPESSKIKKKKTRDLDKYNQLKVKTHIPKKIFSFISELFQAGGNLAS